MAMIMIILTMMRRMRMKSFWKVLGNGIDDGDGEQGGYRESSGSASATGVA